MPFRFFCTITGTSGLPPSGYTDGYSFAPLGPVNLRVSFICSFVSTTAGIAFFVAFLCVVVASPLSGQEFRIGFVGGTPIASSFVQSTSVYGGDTVNPPSIFTVESGPRSFIAGLSLEALISSRFSLEGNVLHRNLWAMQIYTLYPGSNAASTTTNEFVASTTWEFRAVQVHDGRQPLAAICRRRRLLSFAGADGRAGAFAGAALPVERG